MHCNNLHNNNRREESRTPDIKSADQLPVVKAQICIHSPLKVFVVKEKHEGVKGTGERDVSCLVIEMFLRSFFQLIYQKHQA